MATSPATAERKKVYSICGMCAVRCPIEVEVEHGRVVWIQGNPHDKGMGTSLCAKGSAGIALEYDTERPQHPMIRTGERGAGQWRRASWDEALDFIAEKLLKIIDEDGGQAIALSDRGGPFNDLTKSFLKSLGSPNYFNHDVTCGRNTHHASRSILGLGRTGTGYDIKNTKHIVLFGRNMLESFKVKEAKQLIDALDAGAKMTYIDPRATLTAAKATRYWRIRPNTEYALALALANHLIKNNLYDAEFVRHYCTGFEELVDFIQPYTPEWAEQETGVPADEIKQAAVELSQDKPHVIIHPGWMTARHRQSFYTSRMVYVLNVLLGAFEAKGGLFLVKDPGAVGKKGLKSLGADIPAPEAKRVDGAGWKLKHIDPGPGLLNLMYQAIDTGDPYPIRAYFAYRHDPLLALPDPEEQKRILAKVDLLVSIDVNYSETAWFADVILPEATYLERSNILATEKGLKPAFRVRHQAVEPLYDSRPAWWIFTELVKLVGRGEYFPYEDITDMWDHQLQGTGVKIEDFAAKGSVGLVTDPVWLDRDELPFKTPSGRIELVSSVLTEAGFPSLAPYESPPAPVPGEFRLLFGRTGVHAHGQSINNPYLNEIMPTNVLWINTAKAKELGLADGDWVEVTGHGEKATVRANVTDFIHPEAVFALHGFGRSVPAQTRAYNRGLGDHRFQKGLLLDGCPVGGGLKLTECLVKVKKAQPPAGGK
ncbi:MAG: molybdopterin-dependent oxidoreductase [Proteobacteria bacterium]|nr:molybdopterin-dependent oxidoreductase [Pseudomonadota bacterium]